MADGLPGILLPTTADRWPSAPDSARRVRQWRHQNQVGRRSTRASRRWIRQPSENQVAELQQYIEARGWTAREYVDEGVSGSTNRRPALDELLQDAKRRRFDVLVCWRLDRLGRNLRHLILFLEELQSLGIAFVSLAEGIDATSPAGRLQMHILGAIAEFERARISERVVAGLARAKRQGKTLGRPVAQVPTERLATVEGLSVSKGAKRLGVSRSTLKRWRKRVQQTPEIQA